jgi:hypothetical protein
MARIQAIYRYPVKGLSPEPLPRTALTTGETVPGDRLYAIENGPSGFDPAAPSYLAKQHFLMLMRNERLAKLCTIFDHSSHTLSLARECHEVARGDLRTQDGRSARRRRARGQARRRLRSRGARQDPRLVKVTLRLHVNLALRERVRSLARLR